MKYAALALMVVTGCIHTPSRPSVQSRPNLQQEFPVMIGIVTDLFGAVTGHTDTKPPGFGVSFVERSQVCPDSDTCHGSTNIIQGELMVYLADESCLPKTSLAHELTHILWREVSGSWDELHGVDMLWGAGGVVVRAQAAGFVAGLCK